MSKTLELPIYSERTRRPSSVLIYHEDYSEAIISDDEMEKKYQFKWKANTYKYRFNILLFVQALIVNCLYLFGAGVLVEAIKLITGWKLLNNLSSGIWLLPNKIKFLIIVIFPFVLFGAIQCEKLGTIAVHSLIKKGLFIAIFLSCMIAHTNKKFPKLLSSVKLPAVDLKSLYASFASKSDIENEFQRTIMRLKLDITCLYFKFLQEKVDIPELQRDAPNHVKTHRGQIFQYESGKVAKEVPFDSLVEQSIDFERNVFEKNYLNNFNHLDKTSLYGYNLGAYHLEKALSTHTPAKVYPLLISAINLVGPIWITMSFLDGNFGDLKNKIFTAIFAVLNFGFCLWIIRILDQGVTNLRRRVFLMHELGNLIEFGKQKKPNTQEPNINIFDPMSLRTWLTLRKVYMNFDDRRMQATGASLTFILILHSFLVAIFFLESIRIIKFYGPTFKMMLAIYSPSCFIYAGFFAAMAFYGFYLNRQFENHQGILRNNKTIISSLFEMYPHFTRDDPLIPKTYIYSEGLKALRNPNGEFFNTHEQERNSEAILRAYKQISKELKIEENKNPFRLMGIPQKDQLFMIAALCVFILVVSVVCTQLPDEMVERIPGILQLIFGLKR